MASKNAKDPEILLKIENVTVARGEVLALKNFSWSIRRGEHWVILGANGSGKSTLVQLLQGWLWSQEGEISVLDRVFGEDDVSELRRHVAWVGNEVEPQFPAHQTVAEVAASGILGTLGIQFELPTALQKRAALRSLALLGLAKLAKRPFNELSQGQRRRTVIARALGMRPDLLLLDEPTSGLDPVSREKFLGRLAKLLGPDSNPGMIYITHHLEEILPSFTHVLLLKAGRVVAAGPKAAVLKPALLEKTFGAKLKLSRHGGRLWVRGDSF